MHGDTEGVKLAQWKKLVKIPRANWKHTCGCSAKTQTMGRKVSGFHQRNILDRKLKTFLELIENNCTSNNMFCKIMTKMGFKGDIQAIDIANFRTKELLLRFSGKKITIDDVTQCIEHLGIVEDFPHVILNEDMDVAQAKEILLNVLQESGGYWKVEELMVSLKQKCLCFKYTIMRDANRYKSTIGVVWTTKIMHEAFHQYGRILSINSIKSQMNSIHCPYSAPMVSR